MNRKNFLIVFVVFVSLAVGAIVPSLPAFAQDATPEPVQTPYAYPPDAGEPAGITVPPGIIEWGRGVVVRGGWLLIVILIHVALGVTSSVVAGTFQWKCLADFLANYFPKLLAWVGLEALSLMPGSLKEIANLSGFPLIDALGPGAYTIILVAAIGAVLSKAEELGVLPVNIPGVKSRG